MTSSVQVSLLPGKQTTTSVRLDKLWVLCIPDLRCDYNDRTHIAEVKKALFVTVCCRVILAHGSKCSHSSRHFTAVIVNTLSVCMLSSWQGLCCLLTCHCSKTRLHDRAYSNKYVLFVYLDLGRWGSHLTVAHTRDWVSGQRPGSGQSMGRASPGLSPLRAGTEKGTVSLFRKFLTLMLRNDVNWCFIEGVLVTTLVESCDHETTVCLWLLGGSKREEVGSSLICTRKALLTLHMMSNHYLSYR